MSKKIVFCNKEIKNIKYSGFTITKVYGCGGELVYEYSYNNNFLDSHYISGNSVVRVVYTCDEIPNNTTVGCNNVKIFNPSTGICESDTHLIDSIIGDCVLTIDDYSFRSCENLSAITIGSNVETIGHQAFRGCANLREVVIPSSVTTIENYAFADCTKLGNNGRGIVMSGSTPPTISANTFDNTNNCNILIPCDAVAAYETANVWSGLKSRFVPYDNGNCIYRIKVKYLDSSTYSAYCDEKTVLDGSDIPSANTITEVEIGDCITEIYDGTFLNKSYLTSVTIPDSVTTIGDAAFSGSYNLTNIHLPSGLTAINDELVFDCYSLSSLTIPASVTSIGRYVVGGCSGLSYIRIESETPPTISETSFGVNGCPIQVPCNAINTYLHDSWWRNFAIYLEPYGCSFKLKTIYSNKDANMILCNTSTTLTSTEVISYGTPSAMTYATVGDCVQTIEERAFSGYTNLTILDISSAITSIGEYAFYRCSGLTSVTIHATTPPNLGTMAFSVTNNCPIYVPAESVDLYKNAINWLSVKSRVQAIPT